MADRTVRRARVPGARQMKTTRRRWRWSAPLWGVAVLASLTAPVLVAPDVASAQSVETTWMEESPASSPPARSAELAYDAGRGETVLFGGSDGASLDGTWVWNGLTWQEHSQSPQPPKRRNASMAYHPPSGGVVLFGGHNDVTQLADTWVFNGLNWLQRDPLQAPRQRYGAAMAYDPIHQQLVLFGGYGNGDFKDDTWVWDGVDWREVTPPAGDPNPEARFLPTMAFDPIRGEMVLFGGRDAAGTHLGDTWVWDGSSWQRRATTGPSPRYGHAMDLHPTLGQIVLFGGNDGSVSGETWTWDGGQWEPLNPSASPPARVGRGMTIHGDELVLFGGHDGTNHLNDTWTLQTQVEAPDPGELLDEVPDPGDLMDGLLREYPSDDCDGGTNVVSGHFGGEYAKLRTAPSPIDPGTTMVCVAADDRDEHHLGGRVDVRAGLPGAPVATDDDAEACQGEDGNVTLLSGTVAGGQPVRLDVATVPGDDGDLVWVCTQLTDAVGARLVFSAADATGPSFEPDITEPHPFYTEEPWPVAGQPSAACDTVAPDSVENHLVNARVGATFLGLYDVQPSDDDNDTHWVCFRAQTGPTEGEGGRIVAEATPSTGTDTTGCTWDVVETSDPISAGLFLNWDATQDPPPDTAKVCVTVNSLAVTTVAAETVVPGFEQDTT